MITKSKIGVLPTLLNRSVIEKKKFGYNPSVKEEKSKTIKYLYTSKNKQLKFHTNKGMIKSFIYSEMFKRQITQKFTMKTYKELFMKSGYNTKSNKTDKIVLVRNNDNIYISAHKYKKVFVLNIFVNN